MALKLLTPAELKNAKSQQLSKDLWRAKEIEEAVSKANANLARSEADFALMTARHQELLAKQEEEHQKVLEERKQELFALEERKKDALIPLEVYKERTDTNLKEAQELLDTLKNKEHEIDDLKEALENRLDEVAEREIIVSQKETAIISAQKGVEIQKEQVSFDAQRLTEETRNFYEKKVSEEASLEERKKGITLIEINLEAREERIKRNIEALRVAELKLEDEREMLKRGFEELKQKSR